jgi:endo-1,4-beta-mannosidase
LTWEDFQPGADRIDSRALGDLVRVADSASTAGLRIYPTLFTGHMSGANWLPRWATRAGERGRFPVVVGGRYADVAARNWFADDDVTRAQSRLAFEAAIALRGHPAVAAWDLGNENSNVCVPDSREQARAWLLKVNESLRSADPACRVTIGLHMEDLEQDRRLGPAEAAEACDFLCMHGYPMYAAWARPGDPFLPAFLAGVTRWLGGKDVFFEEFGMPASTSAEEDAADVFVAEALDALHGAGTTGAMLWCYTDYPSAIWGEPPLDVAPHERFFGLWRADGTPKPAVRHLSRYRGVQRRAASPSTDWIDLDPGRYYEAPLENLRHLYERYSLMAVPR